MELGDVVIRHVASAIRSVVRADDLVFRWGGDEFLVLLFHVSEEETRRRLGRLDESLRRIAVPGGSDPITVTVSWGVAAFLGGDALRAGHRRRGRRHVPVQACGAGGEAMTRPGPALLRPALPALLAASLACCGGSGGAKPPREAASRVRAIEFVTYGTSAYHSAALNKIAFARFDPAVIGGPDLSGRNDNTGTFELWLADASGANAACLTCADVPGGPRRNQHKGAPTWHPSGRWIVAAVEMPVHAASHARSHAGTGAYVDLWALSPDGRQWFQLTRYANFATATRFPERPVGALIPRFSRSGRQLVWAEMIGYDEQHPFGIWRLAIADFVADALGPRLVNKITATPGASGTTFYEAWSFSPDDSLLTVASDSGAIHPGFMDVQVWSPRAGTLLNLTRTDDQYEEQAVFSPDGRLIAFMSTRGQTPAYDPSGDFWGTFRTDVWLMQADGRGAERLTYFNDPARSEYLPGAVNRGIPVCWTQDGASIYVDLAQNQGPVQTHETARIYRVFLNP